MENMEKEIKELNEKADKVLDEAIKSLKQESKKEEDNCLGEFSLGIATGALLTGAGIVLYNFLKGGDDE